MTGLIFTYTDWQAKLAVDVAARLKELDWQCLHIGRRTRPLASPSIRSLRGFANFEPDGDLPLLEDPEGFEDRFLSDYIDQMTRYSKGFAKRHHGLQRHYEYRDHFHLTARKIKAYLTRNDVRSVLFFSIPHTGDDYLFYRVAEQLGLRVTILFTSLFRHRFFSSRSLERFGVLEAAETGDDPGEGADTISGFDKELQDSVQTYMGGSYRAADAGNHVLRILMPLFVIATRMPSLLLRPAEIGPAMDEIRRIKRSLKKFRRTMNEIGRGAKAKHFLKWVAGLERDIEALPDAFIYMPLHFQPEMTTAPQGGRYVDQALAIEQLAAKLPPDLHIVVKENPLQGSYNRGRDFVERLERLHNVTIAHPTMSSRLLQERSRLVATITGTAGWEAIRAEKPCICFGYPWYRSCDGVHPFGPDLDLNRVLSHPPSAANTERFVSRIMARAHHGVIYEAFIKDPSLAFAAQNFAELSSVMADLLLGRQDTTFG